MTIGEKRPCITCDREVEIVDEATEGDVVHQKLSCGHTSKRMIRTIQENLSLKELVKSDVVKIQTIAKEGATVQVSGSSGISQVVSFLGLQGTINSIGQLIINPQNMSISNYSSKHIETTNVITANDLQDIFSQIDESNYSTEDKKKIKGVLSKLQKELSPLGGILQTAAPYVQLFINLLTRGTPQ